MNTVTLASLGTSSYHAVSLPLVQVRYEQRRVAALMRAKPRLLPPSVSYNHVNSPRRSSWLSKDQGVYRLPPIDKHCTPTDDEPTSSPNLHRSSPTTPGLPTFLQRNYSDDRASCTESTSSSSSVSVKDIENFSYDALTRDRNILHGFRHDRQSSVKTNESCDLSEAVDENEFAHAIHEYGGSLSPAPRERKHYATTSPNATASSPSSDKSNSDVPTLRYHHGNVLRPISDDLVSRLDGDAAPDLAGGRRRQLGRVRGSAPLSVSREARRVAAACTTIDELTTTSYQFERDEATGGGRVECGEDDQETLRERAGSSTSSVSDLSVLQRQFGLTLQPMSRSNTRDASCEPSVLMSVDASVGTFHGVTVRECSATPELIVEKEGLEKEHEYSEAIGVNDHETRTSDAPPCNANKQSATVSHAAAGGKRRYRDGDRTITRAFVFSYFVKLPRSKCRDD